MTDLSLNTEAKFMASMPLFRNFNLKKYFEVLTLRSLRTGPNSRYFAISSIIPEARYWSPSFTNINKLTAFLAVDTIDNISRTTIQFLISHCFVGSTSESRVKVLVGDKCWTSETFFVPTSWYVFIEVLWKRINNNVFHFNETFSRWHRQTSS